ncbi:MAG: cytochrome-c oxidase, cbb3-type subunit II, partial [Phycisphaerae bacterium]
WWHRKWESRPLVFTFWTLIAVAVASLFEIVPMFVIQSNVPTIASVQPYTPLELYGRDLYIQEGCYLCHSQQIRPILPETKRFGEYSKAGESVYEHPFQWGSRRIGPDLAREGGRQSNLWHLLHFRNPPEMTPRSMMPPYLHLLEQPLDFALIPPRVAAMKAIGVPYDNDPRHGNMPIDQAEALARKQAKEITDIIVRQGGDAKLVEGKQVVALIAYMQRLGTDLTKPPPVIPPAAPSAVAPVAPTTAPGTTDPTIGGAP